MKRINIIAADNGLGLTRDLRILSDALSSTGHRVTLTALRPGRSARRKESRQAACRRLWLWLCGAGGRFDVNIMLQNIRPISLASARYNLLIPNPEWFSEMDGTLLDGIDAVLCRTRAVQAIFDGEAGAPPTRYIGFTSEDRLDASVPRENAFFHLAGGSRNKGTGRLLATWRKHPHWPKLTVVQCAGAECLDASAANIDHRVGYLGNDELRRLQNAHRFHLCPSETEGYGHYLVEAMSVGAVVLATDAPPMNEMVSPERGIGIAWDRTGTQQWATTYFVSEQGIADAVEQALSLDSNRIEALGRAARAWFEDNERAFPERVAAAVGALE